MVRHRIIITKQDHQCLNDLFHGTLVDVFRDKSYLNALRRELDMATIVEPNEVPNDVVTMNSTVRLKDVNSGEVETYTLVYPNDANIAEGKLSILAPLGTAILGYRVGDTIRWKVPSGVGRWRIEELAFQPERASSPIARDVKFIGDGFGTPPNVVRISIRPGLPLSPRIRSKQE